MEREKRECDEIVAPDLGNNTWPTPRGYPLILDDRKAYFFASAFPDGRAAVLMDVLDETHEIERRMNNGDEQTKPSDYIRTVARLAAVNLALQYSDQTISRLIELGAISAANGSEIIRATAGARPDYDVAVKKK